MGHRTDLLAGAKRCLSELGYARTTARDLVRASGTNLASIGYHFGSKEALLDEAMRVAIEEWGSEIGQALAADGIADSTPRDRFVATWTRIIKTFTTHRQLWIATIEALAQSERSPQVRAFLAEAMQQGREGLPDLFGGPAAPAGDRQAVGSLYQALMTGIGVQWLIDPERAPSARDLAVALRAVGESMRLAGAPAPKRHRRVARTKRRV